MKSFEDLEWNEEQLLYIQQKHEDGVLHGIPGSGKTTSIIGRVLFSVKEKVISKGSVKILTFSREATANFRYKVKEMCSSGIVLYNDISTIHSLASKITKHFIGKSSSLQTVVYRASEKLREKVEYELREMKEFKNIQRIIVDEAQDISEVQYNFIIALKECLNVPLELIGDSNQNIYQFQGGSDRFLRSFNSGFSVTLRINYRSTQEIVDLANEARPWKDKNIMVSGRQRTRQETKPLLISGSFDQNNKRILEIVKANLNSNKYIAIIGPIKKSNSKNETYTKIGLQTIANILHKNDILFQIHYRVDGNDETEKNSRKQTSSHIDKNKVHLFTCHGSKGLEFDTVILLNFHFEFQGRLCKNITTQDFRNYYYLVYVGITRAKEELYLVHLEKNKIWPEYFSYKDKIISQKEIIPYDHSEIKFKENDKISIQFSWTRICKNKTSISEKDLAKLEDIFDIDFIETEKLGKPPPSFIQLPEYEDLCVLYGKCTENMFYYSYDPTCLPPCFREIYDKIHKKIEVPTKFNTAVNKFRKIMSYTSDDLIYWDKIEHYRSKLESSPDLLDLIIFLYDAKREYKYESFILYTPNIECWFDKSFLEEFLEMTKTKLINNQEIPINDIFKACLFNWQFANEAGYMWNNDYSSHIEALEQYKEHIKEIAKTLPKGFCFQERFDMNHLPISGVVDGINKEKRIVIELKFSTNKNDLLSHGVQLSGYGEMIGMKDVCKWNFKLYNLYDGSVHNVVPKGIFCARRRWLLYRHLSSIIQTPISNTCFIYDLETSSLDTHSCDIIEIHIEDLKSGIIPLSTLVYRSSLDMDISSLTGIKQKDLQLCPSQHEVVQEIENIFMICENPIMIAHNGNCFDNKIMKRLLDYETFEKITWGDSKNLLYIYSENGTSLNELYRDICLDYHVPHRAEADVFMICQIIQKLGLSNTTISNIISNCTN